MTLGELSDPQAVLQAIREYDRLGKEQFLRNYGYRPAREYFLESAGQYYDSKAIVGVAHGYQFPELGPLEPSSFSGGEQTVARKLRSLGFVLSKVPPVFSSNQLEIGKIYSRADLKAQFDIVDATINNGIFRPAGHNSVWLFVTEKKTPDRTQYVDLLEGDVLRWQGQASGTRDYLIYDHQALGLELLLFYRQSKLEHSNAGFVYEGVFNYLSREGERPASFVLTRASHKDAIEDNESILLGGQLFRASAKVRKAIEDYSMAKAEAFLLKSWPIVENVSRHQPFDFRCRNDAKELRVEVKGTATSGASILLTRGEVEHARSYKGELAVFLVHGIKIDDGEDPPALSGGIEVFVSPWDVEVGLLRPVTYEYVFPL